MLVQEKVSSTILIDTLKGFIDKKEQSKLDSRYFEEGKLEEVTNG